MAKPKFQCSSVARCLLAASLCFAGQAATLESRECSSRAGFSNLLVSEHTAGQGRNRSSAGQSWWSFGEIFDYSGHTGCTQPDTPCRESSCTSARGLQAVGGTMGRVRGQDERGLQEGESSLCSRSRKDFERNCFSRRSPGPGETGSPRRFHLWTSLLSSHGRRRDDRRAHTGSGVQWVGAGGAHSYRRFGPESLDSTGFDASESGSCHSTYPGDGDLPCPARTPITWQHSDGFRSIFDDGLAGWASDRDPCSWSGPFDACSLRRATANVFCWATQRCSSDLDDFWYSSWHGPPRSCSGSIWEKSHISRKGPAATRSGAFWWRSSLSAIYWACRWRGCPAACRIGGQCTLPFQTHQDCAGRQCLRGRDHPGRGRHYSQLVEVPPRRAIGTPHPDGHASGHLWVMFWRYCPEGEEFVGCYLWLELSDDPERAVQTVAVCTTLVDCFCQPTVRQVRTSCGNERFCFRSHKFCLPFSYSGDTYHTWTLLPTSPFSVALDFRATGTFLSMSAKLAFYLGLGEHEVRPLELCLFSLLFSEWRTSLTSSGHLVVLAISSPREPNMRIGGSGARSWVEGIPSSYTPHLGPQSLFESALCQAACSFFITLLVLVALALQKLLLACTPGRSSPFGRILRAAIAFAPVSVLVALGRAATVQPVLPWSCPVKRVPRSRRHAAAARPSPCVGSQAWCRALMCGTLFWALPFQVWAMPPGAPEILRSLQEAASVAAQAAPEALPGPPDPADGSPIATASVGFAPPGGPFLAAGIAEHWPTALSQPHFRPQTGCHSPFVPYGSVGQRG